MNKLKSLLLLPLFLVLLNSKIVRASVKVQDVVGSDSGLGTASVNDLAQNVTNALLFIAGIGSVIAIIIGGIMYITSAGNPENVKKATSTIKYAVIGMALALAAYAIATFVVNVLS